MDRYAMGIGRTEIEQELSTVKSPEKWAIFIGGFRQDEADRTGIEDAYLRAVEFAHQHAASCRRGEAIVVLYCTWNDNFKALAERIFRISGPNAKVSIISYSWGTGRGARLLAYHLWLAGVDVLNLVSCDGVYCSPYLPFVWRAICNWLWKPVIKFTSNVQSAWYCYQDISLPSGHKLCFAKETVVVDAVRIEADHFHIDESEEFKKAAQKAVYDLSIVN